MAGSEPHTPVVSNLSPMASDASGGTLTGGAVFIDRDGVVNEQRTGSYVHSWRDFAFLSGAVDAFIALADANIPTFVVTNQGGVGRGYLTAASLSAIHDNMAASIREAGGRLDAIIHCPHSPADGCACRKPRPGMLLTLAQRFGLALDRSTFIGDNVTDLEAGRAAGVASILVATGEGARSAMRLGLPPIVGVRATEVRCEQMPGLAAVAPGIASAVDHAIRNHRRPSEPCLQASDYIERNTVNRPARAPEH